MAIIRGIATLSGQTGPAVTFASIAAPNLERIEIDFMHSVITVEWNAADGTNKRVELDAVLTTTFTDTIAALLNTVVISGS